MVTRNKILLAQRGSSETKLKLNTITLKEASLAHTNSGDTNQRNQV